MNNSLKFFFFLISNLIRGEQTRDLSTLSNIDEITTNHIHLNLTVNFEKQLIEGSALLNFTTIKKTQDVFLDMVALNIDKVNLINPDKTSKKLKFSVDNPKPFLGQRLKIKLPDVVDSLDTF